MYEAYMASNTTEAGNSYKVPIGIKDTDFYNLIYEFIDLAKAKGLTIRQAQYLFEACGDYVLESTLI